MQAIRQMKETERPAAIATLKPIRDQIDAARADQQKLLRCGKEPVKDPASLFQMLEIKTDTRGNPDDDSLTGYVESRVMDGTLTREQQTRFWKIVNYRTHEMGADNRRPFVRTQAVSESFGCFGIDTPPGPGQAPQRGMVSSIPIATAKRYAQNNEIALYFYHAKLIGNTSGYFSPIVVTHDRSILIVGTKSGLPQGKPFEAGKSVPVVVKLDPAGRKVWERSLRSAGYKDFEGGSLAETPDGGCIAFILSYVDPGHGGATRLVKLNSDGVTVWDIHFRGSGGLNTPFADSLQLQKDGSVFLSGHVYLQKGILDRWQAVVDAHGNTVSDLAGDQIPHAPDARPVKRPQ